MRTHLSSLVGHVTLLRRSRKRRCQFAVCVVQHAVMSQSNQQRPESAVSCCLPQLSSPLSAAAAMFHRRKKRRRPEISSPQDFQHRVHTSFDAATGRYVGLPPQWQSVIDTLRRPRPLVDPSRITEVELRKVRGGRGHSGPVVSHFCLIKWRNLSHLSSEPAAELLSSAFRSLKTNVSTLTWFLPCSSTLFHLCSSDFTFWPDVLNFHSLKVKPPTEQPCLSGPVDSQ